MPHSSWAAAWAAVFLSGWCPLQFSSLSGIFSLISSGRPLSLSGPSHFWGVQAICFVACPLMWVCLFPCVWCGSYIFERDTTEVTLCPAWSHLRRPQCRLVSSLVHEAFLVEGYKLQYSFYIYQFAFYCNDKLSFQFMYLFVDSYFHQWVITCY